MKVPSIVLDTNVFVSALRSRRGASFRLVSLLGEGRFDICVSVPLVLEYEAVAKRMARSLGLRHADIDDILDYLCRTAKCREIHYLWRPMLRDPNDDMVLELAVEAEVGLIVTFNIRDFFGCEEFDIQTVTPQEFLRQIGEEL